MYTTMTITNKPVNLTGMIKLPMSPVVHKDRHFCNIIRDPKDTWTQYVYFKTTEWVENGGRGYIKFIYSCGHTYGYIDYRGEEYMVYTGRNGIIVCHNEKGRKFDDIKIKIEWPSIARANAGVAIDRILELGNSLWAPDEVYILDPIHPITFVEDEE